MSNPIIVKPKRLMVDKQTYNTIRSFVESCTKPVYQFNIGVCRNGVAIFKNKKKWKLTIAPKKAVLRDHRVSIHIYFDSCIEIDFCDQKVCVHDNELKEYDIVPDTKIPYMKPISLYDFVSKVLVYYEVAQDCW